MKGQNCTLIVNSRNGYCFTPEKHPSISSAIKSEKESFGFAYRIFVDGKCVRRGFCE